MKNVISGWGDALDIFYNFYNVWKNILKIGKKPFLSIQKALTGTRTGDVGIFWKEKKMVKF